jgi:hypothetical protein
MGTLVGGWGEGRPTSARPVSATSLSSLGVGPSCVGFDHIEAIVIVSVVKQHPDVGGQEGRMSGAWVLIDGGLELGG